MIWKKPFPAPPHHLLFHIERGGGRRKKKELEKKKKPCLCKLPIPSRFLIIFLEARLVRLLRPHFDFMSSSLWFRSRQVWDVFSDAHSPTDVPQLPFMIIGAYSEVKISREPKFKWKLISTTMHTAVSQASPFLPLPDAFTYFETSPNQQITKRVLWGPEMREEGLIFLVCYNHSTYNNPLCTGWQDCRQELELPHKRLGAF